MAADACGVPTIRFLLYTTWFDAHGETTGEALCDSWNARNAAELARCGGDPFCATALRTPTWAPSAKRILTPARIGGRRHYDASRGIDKLRPVTRDLGRGDKISCGPVVAPRHGHVVLGKAAKSLGNVPAVNVCRPFDEAHMIGSFRVVANGANLDPISEQFGKSKAFKAGDGTIYHTPPNHGHGAACGCVIAMRETAPMIGRIKLADRPIDKRLIFAAVRNCEWCAGTGRIICDDERAGRVSPSHAAGGYAEWRRKNPDWVRDFDPARHELQISNTTQVRGPQVEWTVYDETE